MRGGKRLGAGRKRGFKAIQAEKAREFVVKTVAKNLKPLMDAKLDLALGHYKEKLLPDGQTAIVYKESPDGNAIRYLLDQTIGKPRETIEYQGDLGIKIDVNIKRAIDKIYGGGK